MWALAADRKTFLDIFGKESPRSVPRVVHASELKPLYGREELLLLWDDAETRSGSHVGPIERLPDAIVVKPTAMREFIAWVTTVIGGYRPFTAFFRIID